MSDVIYSNVAALKADRSQRSTLKTQMMEFWRRFNRVDESVWFRFAFAGRISSAPTEPERL